MTQTWKGIGALRDRFRMLGAVQEAEDLVQEAMLRWQRTGRADIREPEGLTHVA